MTDEVNIDLSNYKDRVGQRVAPGRYRVVVDDAELDTASTGNQMINVWLRVQGTEFEGATIVDRLVLTEKSLFRVVGFMQAIGLPTPKKRVRVNLRQFVNKVLDVDVEDGDPYMGRVKSEVRGYLRITSGQGQQNEAADLPPVEGDPWEELTTSTEDEGSGTAEIDTAQVPDEVDLDSIDLR